MTRALPLEHLAALTDDRGLFEHADGDTPRREHGYCLDDAARALIVTVREDAVTPAAPALTRVYLDLVDRAVTGSGRARNRLEYLCLLFARPVPRDVAQWDRRALPELLAYIDSTAAGALPRLDPGRFGVPLDSADRATIARMQREFAQGGLDLRLTTFKRPVRLDYPTYRDLLLVFKGVLSAEAVLTAASAGGDGTTAFATVGYGIAAWHLLNDRPADAERLLRRIIAGGQWPAFGFIAAESDLRRMR